MPLVRVPQLLDHAMRHHYAVGAFVCMNLEMVTAAIRAAEAERSPVVVRVHPEVRAVASFGTMGALVRRLASESGVPIGLSLDHGMDLKDVADAIRAGFGGVMIDAAEQPLDENIGIVRQVAAWAQPLGITVEAAIGHMPHGRQQRDDDLAKVEDAVRLVREGGADILAPAVGNVHGTAHGEVKAAPRLDTERIAALRQATGVPMCLHGGSSIPADQMRAAIAAGVHMVIIYSDVVKAFDRELRRVLGSEDEGVNIVLALEPAIHAASEVIRRKMRELGSSGHASSWHDVG
jgi:fructose-bisphosphate aldolase, class II